LHAITKPGSSPKALRANTYGPPACGQREASLAKASASNTAPHRVPPQPSRLAPPSGASAAGSRNVPEPIMLPITRAVAVQKPSGRSAVFMVIQKEGGDGPVG